ncbi:sensor histidine kinase [Sandarakinorhabdus limnophila]|uniref:sensor histidine kinase n=1 Tax=Sandarakinorhabdus limnophila TaxID=210512 RepID=UPI0026EE94D7|nr:ATP-binding protein [Sandarakinorhabdus limnophila]MCM0032391.1 hypothetical protein [Sandarakinorhabdus limnophila]
MPQSTYLDNLVYVYLGVMGAFAVAQLLQLRPTNRVHIGLWLIASFLSAFGVLFYLNVARISFENFTIFGPLASITGGFLRFFAFSYRRHTFHKSRLARACMWSSLAAIPLIAVPALSPYRLLIGSCIGTLLAAACFFAVLHNPIWKSRASAPVAASLIALGITCVAFAARAATAYPFTADQTFIGQSELQKRGLESVVLMTFFMQLAFTAMIVDLRAREDARNDRISIRIAQRNKRLHKRAQETANVARARLDLVQLLTHEVRQPITNAQASLQSISQKLRSTKNTPNNASFALKSAQSSLDHITLSLSNIIVASTILSDERKWVTDEVDAYAALKISILDFDKENQDRIKITFNENAIYIESVSILLRLVLQNIIEFAIKFSNPDSEIDAHLKIDFELEMVVFDIGFLPADAHPLNQGIFERRPSTDTEPSGISSLGLFVVRQIARELGGEVRLLDTVPGRQNFQLALPC